MKLIEMDSTHYEDIPLIKAQLSSMPLFVYLLEEYRVSQPFKGYTIAVAHVLVANTIPLILALKEGGGDLMVTRCNPPTIDENTIKTLERLGIKVDLTFTDASAHDFAIDCAAYFVNNQPKLGVSEVTRTGFYLYNASNIKVPIINVDDSQAKLIETFYGNPISILEGIKKFIGPPKEYLKNKIFGIVGFGKIGRGIARVMKDYCDVKVFEIDDLVIDKGRQLGFEMIKISSNIKENTQQAKDVDILLSITGFPGVISKTFDKDNLNYSLLLNVGATDEFGDDYSEDEVFMSKFKPFNFNLNPPTPNMYIDPILVAHVKGLEYLIKNPCRNGIHSLPESWDSQIIDKFQEIHNFDLSDLHRYF